MTTILMGAALGGLTLFIWSWFSHMFLPWHHSTYNKFKDPDAVEEVLGANTDANAIYIAPCGIPEPGASKEEKQAAMQAAMAKMKEGPLIFCSIHPGGGRPFGAALGWMFVIDFVAAGILTVLLSYWGHELEFVHKIAIVESVALFAVLTCMLPNWVWWRFSNRYTAVNILDTLVGFGLAGVVLGLVTP